MHRTPMSRSLLRVVKLGAVLLVAAVIGLAVAMGVAMLGHEVLVRLYGEELVVIDDSPPMFMAVATAYLAGIVSSVLVLLIGWRRFVRGPR